MLTFPKPRPAALERKDRKALRDKLDREENVTVRSRSTGRCELEQWYITDAGAVRMRCVRRAIHIHHKLSGIGIRGRQASALAVNKLHLCLRCHQDVHAHVLVPEGDGFRRLV
jgi:hypothetical protein